MNKAHAAALALLLLAPPLSSQNHPGFAESFAAAWSSHDPDKLVSLFTPDATYEDVPSAEVSHGAAEIRKFAASFFEAVPDLKLERRNSSIGTQHGTIEWVFSGTDKGLYRTGKQFSVRGVSVFDLRAGKIFRNLDYYDSASIMKQVGVLPAP
jgi:steroid delta-isomerase-like uncharacterized protein